MIPFFFKKKVNAWGQEFYEFSSNKVELCSFWEVSCGALAYTTTRKLTVPRESIGFKCVGVQTSYVVRKFERHSWVKPLFEKILYRDVLLLHMVSGYRKKRTISLHIYEAILPRSNSLLMQENKKCIFVLLPISYRW